MVEITFRPSGERAWVRTGTGLVAAGEAAGVEIVTGCTRGQCGTDPVRVLVAEPADALEPIGDKERATLDRMGLDATDGWRLACSAKLTQGVVEVDLAAF